MKTVIGKSGKSYPAMTEDSYIKVYLKDIIYLCGLKQSHYELMLCVWKFADHNTNSIQLNKAKKEEIAGILSVSLNTIANSLSFLTRKKILFIQARGIYKLNPHLFGFGRFPEMQRLRATIEWTSNGKTIKIIDEMDAKLQNMLKDLSGWKNIT